MKIFIALVFFNFIFLSNIFSQKIDTLRVKKLNNQFFFFPKDENAKTIASKRINLFYLLISDSLKSNLEIEIENGQLNLTNNDSLLQLKFMSGIKYLIKFVPLQAENKKQKFEFKLLIDGESNLQSDKIKIRFVEKMNRNVFAEFNYGVIN